MKYLKNLKKNNKGFSLVELIIVIAIMAVLVGTLAPQYIRYVEKSKVAADATTIDNFVSALEVLAASPDSGLKVGDKVTVTFDNGKAASYNYSDNATAENLFKQMIDVSRNYALQSAENKAQTVTLTLAYENGIWKVTQTKVGAQNNGQNNG